MLMTVAIVLLVLWALGLVTSYTMGGLIHVLLVIAIAVVLIRVIQGRRVVQPRLRLERMREMRIIGLALVIIGIVGLIYGGINYTRQKTVFEVGSLKATTSENKTFPIPPVVGALSLLGGIALVVADKRRA